MSRLISAFEQFFDGQGNPLISGQLDFFESGSSTVRKPTFADLDENIPNPNPVILNADGRCPNVFGSGSYRVVLKTSDDVQIVVRDPVGGDEALVFGAGWSAQIIYNQDEVVFENGQYWVSLTNNNLANKPSEDDASNWALLNLVPGIRSVTSAITIQQIDSNSTLVHSGTGTITIPANSAEAISVGTVINIITTSDTRSLAPDGGVTLTWNQGGGSPTGTRSITNDSVTSITKISTDSWILTGNGIS